MITLPCSTTRRAPGQRRFARACPSASNAWSPRARRGCRRRQDQRTRTDRCRPPRVRVRGADPVEHRLVAHSARVPNPPGITITSGCGSRQRAVGGSGEHPISVRFAPGSRAANRPGRPAAGTGPRRGRPHRARLAVEDRDRDVHLLIPPGAQPEPAQHQQRLLAERPPRRQDPELGRDVVQVEEAAHAQEPLAARSRSRRSRA